MVTTRPGDLRSALALATSVLLVAANLRAAEPYTPAPVDPILEPWRWTVYTELAGAGVECVTQTSDGAMWFGVDDGVRRYDGLEWKSFTAADGVYGGKVWTLQAGADGSLYAGTDFGISRFDGRAWQRLFPPEGDVPWRTADLELAGDDLWAATDLGLLRLRDGGATLYTAGDVDPALSRLLPYVELRPYPHSLRPQLSWQPMGLASAGLQTTTWKDRHLRSDTYAYVAAVAEGGPADRAGLQVGDRILDLARPADKLYGQPGTPSSLAVVRSGTTDTLTVELTLELVDGAWPLAPVHRVLAGGDGVWAGTSGGPVLQFRPDTGDPGRLYELGGQSPHLARTADGAVWVATAQSVHPIYRIEDGQLSELSAQDLGWPGSQTYASAMVASDGSLWLGALGGLLRVLRDGVWSHYPRNLLPTSGVRVVSLHQAADGSVWAVSRGREVLRLDLSPRYTSYAELSFLGEGVDEHGATWFTDSGRLVRREDDAWTRWIDEEGFFDPLLMGGVSRKGWVWFAGSHQMDSGPVAATAVLVGDTVITATHPDLDRSVNWSGGLESADGSLWISATADALTHGLLGGLLRFDGEGWHHLHGDGAPISAYGFAQLPDGDLITTGDRLRRYDGHAWYAVDGPPEVNARYSHSALVDADGALWVETRAYGLFRRFDGEWTRYGATDGLPGGRVELFRGPDGAAWGRSTGTDFMELVRFDGHTWVPALPAAFRGLPGAWCRPGRDALWFDLWRRPEDGGRLTTRVTFDEQPPETWISLAADEISQPGNTVVSWRGADPWRDTPPEELRFAWRLDDGEWSPYTTATSHTFLELPDGDHVLDVSARDRDLNVDPTPAVARFTVVPPVYKQAWFLGMVAAFLAAIALQTTRIVRRDRRLVAANAELAAANHQITEATRNKSQFLRRMSHDLRSPMNAIIGYTRVVLRRSREQLDPRQVRNLENIQTSSNNLLNLINDILDLSRIEAGRIEVNLQPVDVRKLADECADSLESIVKEGVALQRELDDVGEISSDPDRLRQVLMNLLGNATKFTDSGSITLGVRRNGSGGVEISVADTGIGIPPDDLPHIFDEFRQVARQGGGQGGEQSEGTGLGLAIARKTVELLGGEIHAGSAVGEGTTFTVRLPAAGVNGTERG